MKPLIPLIKSRVVLLREIGGKTAMSITKPMR
jgi:hypothetical protein